MHCLTTVIVWQCVCAKAGHECGPACTGAANMKAGGSGRKRCACSERDQDKHNPWGKLRKMAMSKGARAEDDRVGCLPRQLKTLGGKNAYHMVNHALVS